MNSLIRSATEFEGHPVTTLTYNDNPAWIAREIGNAIGYARRGERLVTKVTGEWKHEFIAGTDFVVLEGEDLCDLKEVLGQHTESVGSRARHLVLLLEPGLHLVLAKTNKPIGVRLRRFIVGEVLPQIVRDGRYLASRKVVDGQLVGRQDVDPRAQRELRLTRKLELEDRKFKVRTLQHTLAAIGDQLSSEAVTSLRVVAAEIALERDLSSLKPAVDADWKTPSQIARRLGISSNRVGRAITKLNLRGDIPGLSRAIMNKARHSDRNVVSFLYSPDAVTRIERQLSDDGHIALPEPHAAA